MLHDTGWFFSLKCASGQVTFARAIDNIIRQISTVIQLVPEALSDG